jgi:hypothetical protein
MAAMSGLVALATTASLIALTGCGSQTAKTAALHPASASTSSPRGSGSGSVSVSGSGDRDRVSSASESAEETQSGITGGALFGGNYPLVSEEANLGRTLAIVRLYFFIGDTFPAQRYAKLMKGGRTVLVSLDSNGASYASIAAGDEDTAITAFLESVNQAAVQYNLGAIYFSFEHEPDNDAHRPLGSPAQFIQAWDHIHQLATSAHLDWNDGGRLHWVFILIHTSYTNWRASSFWPGPGEVDIVAADGYDSSGCGSAHQTGAPDTVTPDSLFDPLISFAAANGGLPVFLSEWGSDNIPSGVQADFITQMQTYVADQPEIAAALYWNTHVGNCDYQVNGDQASISAMATMGQSPALQGQLIPAG